jgi:hypothetical protein
MNNRSAISESAVRARFDRRRRLLPRPRPAGSPEADARDTAATPTSVDEAASSTAAAAAAQSPSLPPLLRRWSVAELVARAAARPSPREPVRC